jgi:[ribosomal protein S18]-alanine N-acetyltransferase
MTGIETATQAHAPAMAAIHRAAFPPGEVWGEDVMTLQLGLAGAFGRLHPDGGMVLARVAADEADILTIAVLPDARRRGLGRALLLAAMEEAARRGAKLMFLEVGVANDAAGALYAACGFVQVGRRRGYYANGADALVMRARLTASPRDATAAG